MIAILKTFTCICFIFIFSVSSWAATIISPAQDETVYAGSTIFVVVKPDHGEQWQGFVMGFKAFEYDPISNTFKLAVQIPSNTIGYLDDIKVHGIDKDYKEVELNRRVLVKLPPNVVLKSIVIYPDYIVLEKMPPGSKPEDIEAFGSINLIITGMYSDSVKRKLTASSSGTTYISSNEKVVAVSSEGRVTAQGLGSATIAVRNGKYSANVKVVVKTYK